jgi:hypothetical protein
MCYKPLEESIKKLRELEEMLTAKAVEFDYHLLDELVALRVEIRMLETLSLHMQAGGE